MQTESIPGYTYGTGAVSPSPISLEDFEKMKQAVMFGPDDVQALRKSYEVVARYADEILDTWYGFIGSLPQLIAAFANPKDGRPNQKYLDAVRQRFRAWILDTASANYDQQWLDYQHESGLRHWPRKNQTDQVEAASVVPFRYLVPLVYPVVSTLRPFLERGGFAAEEIEKMQSAWLKSCLLQITLWSYAYVDPRAY